LTGVAATIPRNDTGWVNTITLGAANTGIVPGMSVTGPGNTVGTGAKVLSVSGTTVTLSVPNANTVFTPSSPTTLTFSTGVVAIAAGYFHSVALRSDGSVVAWGDNTANQSTVPAGLQTVASAASLPPNPNLPGTVNTLTLAVNNVVIVPDMLVTGPSNSVGAGAAILYKAGASPFVLTLSVPNAINTNAGSVSVPILYSPGVKAVAIAAGNEHTMALRSDGIIVAWGRNVEGETCTSGLSPIAANATLPGAITASVNLPAGPASTVTLGAANATIVPGMFVTGGAPGTIGSGATVVSKDGTGLVLTLSVPNTNTAAIAGVTLTFCTQPNNTVTLAAPNAAIVPGMYVTGPVGSVGVGALVVGKAADNVTLTLSGRNAYSNTVNTAANLTFSSGINATAIAAGGDTSYVLKPDATVTAWGDNLSGQTNVPNGLTGVKAIAAGGDHAVALKNDGKVVAWGRIWNGSAYINETVPAGLGGVTAIAAGAYHTVAVAAAQPPIITANPPAGMTANQGGTATMNIVAAGAVGYQWRKNGVAIPGATGASLVLTNVQAADASDYSVVVTNATGSVTSTAVTLAVNVPTSGSVLAWGAGATNSGTDPEYGQSIVPNNLNAGTTTVAAGLYHSVALKSDGTLAAWGFSGYGHTTIPAGLSTVTAVATLPANPAGTANTVTMSVSTAVSTSIVAGMVVNGPPGTVGPGATVISKSTVSGVTTLTLSVANAVSATAADASLTISPVSPVTAVAAGGFHTLALKSDGTVVAWGAGTSNTAGTANLGQSSIPLGLTTLTNVAATVPRNDTGWVNTITLSAANTGVVPGMSVTGPGNTVGLGAKVLYVSGTVVTLSVPNANSTFTPSSPTLLNFYSGVTAIAAGYYHSVALRSDGSVVAWGDNTAGQSTIPAGLQTLSYSSTLLPNPNLPGTINTLTLAANNVNIVPDMLVTGPPNSVGAGAAILYKAGASPWVLTLSVPNAINTNAGSIIAPVLYSPGVKAVAIAAGNEHTMALRSDGTIVAWGRNVEGETCTGGLSPIAANATLPGTITASVNLPAGPASTVTLGAANAAIVPGMFVTGGPPGTIGAGATVLSKDADGVTLTLSVSNTNNAAINGVMLTFCTQLNNTVTLAAPNAAIVPGMYVTGPAATVGVGAMVVSKGADNVTLTLSGRNAYVGTTTSAATALRFSAGIKATAIAAGGDTSYVLKPDATVVAWGDNFNGQTNVPNGLTGVKAIAAGGDHAVALKNDGTVVAWGKIWNGSAYINETVPAGLSGVTAIAAGAYHTVALAAAQQPIITANPPASVTVTQGGTATMNIVAAGAVSYQWRKNGVAIPGATGAALVLTNVQAADASNYSVVVTNASGSATSTAVTLTVNVPTPGSVLAWGAGSTNTGAEPEYGQSVVPGSLGTGTSSVAGGLYHSVALKSDGTVVAWGYNGYGQTTIPAGLATVTAVAAGGFHTLALKSDGSVVAWGAGTSSTASPGTANLAQSYIPLGLTTLTGVFATIPRNDTGMVNTITLSAANTGIVPGMSVTGPGNTVGPGAKVLNVSGTTVTLSVANANTNLTPSAMAMLTFSTGVVAISAGYYHSVALRSDGSVVAWGDNSEGQATVPAGLQDIAATAYLPPNPNPPGTVNIITLAANNTNIVPGMMVTGPPGSVGAGATLVGKAGVSPFDLTLSVPNLSNTNVTATNLGFLFAPGQRVTAIAAGFDHTVALKSDGTVVAWGRNVEGQTAGLATLTATASLPDNPTPPGTANTVTLAAANAGIVPGMLVTGATGTVGVGATVVSKDASGLVLTLSVPNANTGAIGATSLTFASGVKGTAIAAGGDNSYALMADTTVRTWGDNSNGQRNVPNGLTGVTAIAAGGSHAVALKSDGTVAAWGQIWNGSEYVNETVPAGLSGVTAIAAGAYHTVAVAAAQPPLMITPPAGVTVIQGGTATMSIVAAGAVSYQWRKNGVAIPGATGAALVLTNAQAADAGNYSVVVTNANGSITSMAATLTVDTHAPGSLVAWGAGRTNTSVGPEYGQSVIPDGLSGGVTAVSGGLYHTVALKSNGTVTAWGYNGYGQTTVPTGLSTVTAVASLLNTVTAVATLPVNPGTVSTVTITVSPTVNPGFIPASIVPGMTVTGPNGTVGAGATVVSRVTSGSTTVLTLSVANGLSSIPVDAALTIAPAAAWGSNPVAIAVTPTSNVSFVPASVIPGMLVNGPPGTVGIGATVISNTTIATTNPVGSVTILALSAVHAVSPLGDTALTISPVSPVTAVAAGAFHTLVLKRDGSVVAWGAGAASTATAGTANLTQASVPAGLVTLTGVAASIPANPTGLINTITLNAANPGIVPGMSVTGPGNTVGLGAKVVSVAGTTVTLSVPNANTNFTPTVPTTLTFSSGVVAIAAGSYHSVALKSDGSVVAWGDNTFGQTSVPAGLQTMVVAIAAGYDHTVALKSDGTVVTWGYNVDGQTGGLASVTASATLPANPNPPGTVNTVTLSAASAGIVPGMLVTGAAGTVGAGATVVTKDVTGLVLTLSIPNANTDLTAGAILTFSPGTKATAIAAGVDDSYALMADATVRAWGDNSNGQTNVPNGLTGVTAIAAGGGHALALKSDGTVTVWGKIWDGSAYVNETVPAGLSGVTAIAAGAYHSLAIGAPPVITVQPLSVSVTRGGVATFTVTAASSAPLSYQWRTNDAILGNAGNISGATTATLTVINVQATDVGGYSVIVSNAFDSVPSTVAGLTLIIPVVNTGTASGINASTATLQGTVNPNGMATTAWFDYGMTLSYGGTALVTLSPVDGSATQNLSADISGLQAGTTYHYRLSATNTNGTSQGGDMTFLTAGTLPFAYTTANGAVSITGYTGSDSVASIPDSINGMPVTNIGSYAFYQCVNLTGVIIPNGVTSIGSGAFYNCSALTNVIIPDSVTRIGDYAFASCVRLGDITIPGHVTSIGSYAFSFCSALSVVTIPDSVTSIGSDVFSFCTSLAGVTLPGGITSISDGMFYACGNLRGVTIPASVTTIGSEAFYYCTSLEGITIPTGVASIGDYVFYYCNSLTHITIPASVITIGSYAFHHCVSLTGITISNGVVSIGDWAFASCSGLANVTIPASVTTIGTWAFSGCGTLAVLKFQGNSPGLGSYGFYNDTHLTVYYMSGTTGWNPTYGGRPTVMLGSPIAPSELAAPIFGISGGSVNFTVQPSVAGRCYQLQCSDTMASGSWQNLGPLRVGDGSRLDISTPYNQAEPRRFYRLALDSTTP